MLVNSIGKIAVHCYKEGWQKALTVLASNSFQEVCIQNRHLPCIHAEYPQLQLRGAKEQDKDHTIYSPGRDPDKELG